jgi:hypothetical protein
MRWVGGLFCSFGLMKNKFFLSSIFVFLVLAQCLAQVPDSVRNTLQAPVFQQDTLPTDSLIVSADTTQVVDSLVPKKRNFLYRTFKEDYPNPNKALYLSLMFPAGGQIYNKRWWKVPIVWGGYAALIYAAKYNTGLYKRLKVAYLKERQGMEHEFSNTNLDAGDLKRLRDDYDKKKQLSYIGMFGLTIIQSAEAFVDCHLKTFDVSDDLSLRFKPSFEPSFASNLPAMGVGVAFCFGK